MREMKDSHVVWMGKIPACWKVIPVKYVVNIENGSDPKKEGLTPVYGSGNASFKTCGEHKEGPAVLLGRKGTVNIPQYVEGKYWNVDTAFDAKPVDDYNLKLFYYSAICFDYDNYSTQTALPSMTQSTYNNFRVPLPSSDEQNRIVNYLDSKCSEIDAISADIQKEIEILEQYKRSVITEAVTKGLNPDVEMKDSGVPWIGKMPANWACIKGKYILKYMQKPVKPDDGVITCFRDGEVTLRSNRREDGFTMADKEIGYQGIDVGDLVVHGMDGFAGAIGISDSRGKASPVLNVLDSRQNKKYIMYYLRSMAYGDVFAALATGIRVRSCDLRWNKLSVLLYPVPPLEEQAEIVQYIEDTLNKVNGVIGEKKQQLTVIDSYKKSLIYEYVTGKKEVV